MGLPVLGVAAPLPFAPVFPAAIETGLLTDVRLKTPPDPAC